MTTRTKLIVQPEHVIIAVVEIGPSNTDTLFSAQRLPRADFERLIIQAAKLGKGATSILYGDGGGETPDSLPL